MNQLLLKSEIKTENDIVWARKKSRQFAEYLKLDNQSQIRLATAVSEITRNAFQYAGGGTISFQTAEDMDRICIFIEIKDRGPGIPHIDEILSGTYVSKGGMGVGMTGAKNLVDDMLIDTDIKSGTKIILKKYIPFRKNLLSQMEIKELVDSFLKSKTNDPIEEVQKQNHEILITMAELQQNKAALLRANQSLEDKNQGIVALYAELDEKAAHLRKANESKTSFLADMTHEFRSPLNSILSISEFLLEDAITEKASERQLQIEFIIKASNDLSTMVNDLLDIAKIEAGKVQIRANEFSLKTLLSSLRGLMSPLNKNNVAFTITDIPQDHLLYTDEIKLAQILRNLISNALKYTTTGSVTVKTSIHDEQIKFKVIDTGVGISEDNLAAVFSEFKQINNPLQAGHKGTGLGLPLALKLSNLLGGSLKVESTIDVGSTFSVIVPVHYTGPEETIYDVPAVAETHLDDQLCFPARPVKVLMVDDEEVNRLLIYKMIKDLPIEYWDASDGDEALEITQEFMPDMIILDLVMPRLDGAQFIKLCKENSVTAGIPIFLYTSKDLGLEERRELEKQTEKIIFKDARSPVYIQKIVQNFIGQNRRSI